MLPAVTLTIYALIMLLMLLILIPILSAIFIDKFQEFVDKIVQQKHLEPVDGTMVLSFIWIFIAIITGLF